MSIEIQDLTYVYHQGTPLENKALDKVSLKINKNEWLSIVGHTGSGKSTLAQHLNALLQPQTGEIRVDGLSTSSKTNVLRMIRQKVGLVFQYPEQQLFAETVYDEIAFAPLNWKTEHDDLDGIVTEALYNAGLDSSFKTRNPFQLSGGEKRRVAIASVLSASPSYLVLDEPTAGLDSSGKRDLLGLLASLRDQGLGIVLITHDLELALKSSERILVIEKGKVVTFGTPDEVLDSLTQTCVSGLILPDTARLARNLQDTGWDVPHGLDETELAKAIIKVKKR
jgi:energy-coupling factor transport system ATP-binding protein